MKYIILNHGNYEVSMIFSEDISHDTFVYLKPVSAGFVNIYGTDKPLEDACCCENAIRVDIYGESISLKLKTRDKDEAILLRDLMRHYH